MHTHINGERESRVCSEAVLINRQNIPSVSSIRLSSSTLDLQAKEGVVLGREEGDQGGEALILRVTVRRRLRP